MGNYRRCRVQDGEEPYRTLISEEGEIRTKTRAKTKNKNLTLDRKVICCTTRSNRVSVSGVPVQTCCLAAGGLGGDSDM